MKQADDFVIERLLDMCRYIKWENLNEEEFEKLRNEKNVEK